MADAENGSHDGGHDDHDHHGPDYLAHHFESTEQQYDASKLGIWIFLVTEVLFFSGLFVAYTLYRYHHPEIFAQASEYLDTAMGAVNTIVLLFSSLTMAWAVRCAMTENRKGLVSSLLITIMCACMFLGIKAVEYTHKWDLGIFVRSSFNYHETAHHGISDKLIYLSIPFAVVAIGFLAAAIFSQGTGSKLWAKFFGAMFLGVMGYFVGVGVGLAYEPIKAAIVGEDASHATAHADGHEGDEHAGDDHDGDGHSEDGDEHAEDEEGHDEESDGEDSDGEDSDGEATAGEAQVANAEALDGAPVTEHELNRNIGIFFSIYYFMTGLHGFHVLGGIAALSWLLFRAMRGDFYKDYFGPVDNVGLYWHLVDLIWIYLFPLLYLIG